MWMADGGIKQVGCGRSYQFPNVAIEMRDQQQEDQIKYSKNFKTTLSQKNDEYDHGTWSESAHRQYTIECTKISNTYLTTFSKSLVV